MLDNYFAVVFFVRVVNYLEIVEDIKSSALTVFTKMCFLFMKQLN